MLILFAAVLQTITLAPELRQPDPCDGASPFVLGKVDRVARVTGALSNGRPFDRPLDRGAVRVRLRFVVGCDGVADPTSFALVATSDAAYTFTAIALVQSSRFSPATVAGKPVRQIVERDVVWLNLAGDARTTLDCPPPNSGGTPTALRSFVEPMESSPKVAPASARVIIS